MIELKVYLMTGTAFDGAGKIIDTITFDDIEAAKFAQFEFMASGYGCHLSKKEA